MNKKLLVSLASCLLASIGAKANTFGLYDDSFTYSMNGTTVLTSGIFEARWGTFSGNVFTPLLGAAANASNSGYVDVASPELVANLNQTNNTTVPAGSQLALALTFLADDASYQSGTEVILTDPSWVAPVFVFLEDPFVTASFTPSTTALKGNFLYGATGNDTISAVPEPSTYAAILGLAALGAVAVRRRRSS